MNLGLSYEKRNALGCKNLGVSYAKGLGVARDDRRAAVLFEKSCEGGEAEGCSNLGVSYDHGLGVPRDSSRAFALFEKACERG